MKHALLHILLFAYVLTIVKPVVPYVTDAMAHAFWYADHIKTVHHQHGGDHVHYELSEDAKKNMPDKNSSKKDDSGSDHLAVELKHDVSGNNFITSHSLFNTEGYNNPSQSFDAPPPKISN